MRPILPCHKCGTADYVWTEPSNYGEGGRYTAYHPKCENCGQTVYPKGYTRFETEDQAMEAWNLEQRSRQGEPLKP